MALPNYTDIFVAKVYEGKWYKICIQATKIDHVIENSLTVNIEKAKAIGFQNEFFNNPIIIDLKQIKYNIEVQGRLASQTTTINDASIDANNVNLTANRARWHFEHFLMNTRGSCILAWRGGSYDDYTKAGSHALSETVVIPHNTTYGKNTMVIAVGVDINL